MKKLTILATAAVLGVSSLAVADPQVTVRDHRDNDRHGRYDDRLDSRLDDDNDARDYYFDDDADFGEARFNRDTDGRYWRGKRQFIRAEHQPQWVSLGTAGSGKTTLKAQGRYQSVRLDVNGYLRIKQVLVLMTDGTTQRVRMSSMSRGRSAPLVIDLGGTKQVSRVIVYAAQYGRGTVSVSGLEGKRYYWKRFSQR